MSEKPDNLRYMRLAGRILTLDALRRATDLPIVDLEVVVSFLGGPEEPAIALVVKTEDERTRALPSLAAVTEGVRKLLAEGGYPAADAHTASVSLASQEQIQAAGGWMSFFR